jgi:hypothetical protein
MGYARSTKPVECLQHQLPVAQVNPTIEFIARLDPAPCLLKPQLLVKPDAGGIG